MQKERTLYNYWIIYEAEKDDYIVKGDMILKNDDPLTPPKSYTSSEIERFYPYADDLCAETTSGIILKLIGPMRGYNDSNTV